ncbi:MAG: substrate-binding domain-containing protein [Chloroflexi bacterium]|nr:substrate-binding domain-containing protein [Chloroflexota bacterium]
MVRIRLCVGIFALLYSMGIGAGQAQDHEMVRVSGSAIVNGVIEELVSATDTGSGDMIAIKTRGTGRGIQEFCAGEVDAATASRKMTSDELAACEANEIAHSEFLIGHHIAAFVAHADVPAQCLQFDALQDVFRPTASNVRTDWSFYDAESADLPLSVILPDVSDLTYVIADDQVLGEGLRLDVQYFVDANEAMDIVAETPGALALVPWNMQVEDNKSIAVLEVGGGGLGACSLPSAENVEGENYPFARSLYFYVNRASLEGKERLAELTQFSISEASAAVIEAATAVPPSDTIYAVNADVLANADTAPGVSGDVGDFRIPPDLSGEIRIVGAANAHQVLSGAGDGLGEQLTISFGLAGTKAGIGALCDSEADIAVLDGPAEASALENCAANGVVTIPLPLGAQATVLIGNAADEYAACLTTEQIDKIWRAGSTDMVMNWADIDDAFPAQLLTLFGLPTLDIHTDILLQTGGETIPPARRDTERDFDPLYRAAAVGNVSGGLTYMSWRDYQSVVENEQANIQLVTVDAGKGCVEANRGSIEDGIYPLARRASLLVSEASLAEVNVQAYLWSLLNDDNWTALERSGFISASNLELPILRRELLRWYAEAESRYPPAGEETAPEDDSETADSGDDNSAG